jgi:two-component system C4-dicarboxylate transport sensor histidine kinase DctB
MNFVASRLCQPPINRRFEGVLGTCWSRWLLLVVAMVLIKTIEMNLAAAGVQPILNIYALPFLLGIAVLPLLQEGLLGIVLLGLATATAHLHPDIAPHDAIQRLPVQAAAIGLCLWASHLRTRLDQSQALLQSIISHSPVGIALCHCGSGRIAMVNPAMARLLQKPQHELIGRPWNSVAEPLPHLSQSARMNIAGRAGALTAEVTAEVTATALPAQRARDALLLVHAVDISQRMATEEALSEEHGRLQQALQVCLKGVTLVHELRQPLALLLLQCRQLLHLQEQTAWEQGQQAALGEGLTEGLTLLHETAQKIDAITVAISGLLRSANRSSHQPVNLTTLLGNLVADLRNQLEQHNVQLICQGLERPARIDADQGQLRIAISNLLRNAIEALQERQPAQRRLLIRLESDATEVWLTIADSGPGLPSLDVDALHLCSSKNDGLGLGLFTAAMVTRNHGGQMQLGTCPDLGGAAIRLSLHQAAKKPQAGNG